MSLQKVHKVMTGYAIGRFNLYCVAAALLVLGSVAKPLYHFLKPHVSSIPSGVEFNVEDLINSNNAELKKIGDQSVGPPPQP